jgi:hypothetical protein
MSIFGVFIHLVYMPANAANTSGTLTVNDGTHSAHIKFVGTYTSASFTPVYDGIGGVKITDPPVEQKPGNAAPAIFDNAGPDGEVSGSDQLTLARPTDTLWLDGASTSTGKVANFGAQKSIDLPSIPLGVQTTLGYSENCSNPGGILSVKEGIHTATRALLGDYMATSFVAAAVDGRHAATIALLGNYMAGSFATTAGNGGMLMSGTPQAEQQSLLTHPPHW